MKAIKVELDQLLVLFEHHNQIKGVFVYSHNKSIQEIRYTINQLYNSRVKESELHIVGVVDYTFLNDEIEKKEFTISVSECKFNQGFIMIELNDGGLMEVTDIYMNEYILTKSVKSIRIETK